MFSIPGGHAQNWSGTNATTLRNTRDEGIFAPSPSKLTRSSKCSHVAAVGMKGLKGPHAALEQVKFNLGALEQSFRSGDGFFEHHLNNFLSSAQAVFWAINKEYAGKRGYLEWQRRRGTRLPKEAIAFKEMRNVSVKEAPVTNSGVIIGIHLDGPDIVPAHATVTGPWVDSTTGRPTSDKVTITTKEGVVKVVEGALTHDFSVTVKSSGKDHSLPAFLTAATAYVRALTAEVAEADRLFAK